MSMQPDPTLENTRHDLQCLKSALAPPGLRACCYCGKFFRPPEPGQLFNCGELVCVHCVHHWWKSRSPELSAKRRETVETKLVNWLMTHDGVEVIRTPETFPDADQHQLRLVVSCSRCEGTGISLRKRCTFCNGTGAIRVAIRNQKSHTPA